MTHNTGYDSAYVYQKTDYDYAQNGRYIITAATIAHFLLYQTMSDFRYATE